MQSFVACFLFIGTGIIFTIKLLIGGMLIGLSVGIVLSICRYNKMGASFINRVISIIRGTPLILQLSVVYFITPSVIGIELSTLSAGIITFGLNSSAYLAEIFRAGIESIPKQQFEAAKTLQIPSLYAWKDIILPQVIKNVLPSLINEMIALLKETALISIIGGMDITRSAQIIAAEQFTYFLPFCVAGAYYYVLVLIIEQVGKKIEKKGYV